MGFLRTHKDKNWTIPNLIDLEYFFVEDRNTDENLLSQRDRDFYLSNLKDPVQERSLLILKWLDFRRENHRSKQKFPLPGEKIDFIVRLFPYVLFILGILAGVSLGKIVMQSGGYINVFFAFLLLVFVPFLFTLVFGLLFPAYRFAARRRPLGKSGEWVTGKLFPRLSRLFQRKVKGQNRVLMDQVWGNLKARSSLYSGVMNWFSYRSFQSFGLGLSCGVMGTLIILGLFTSMSFGWGTTFGLNETFVYKMVDLSATPWAFFGFNNLPTLEQVRQSLFQFHGNFPSIISQDVLLRNVWAKFFLWAIVIYTVLPRLALLGIANLGLNSAYRRLSFNDAQCEALLRRMKHPQVRTGGEGTGRKPGEVVPFPANGGQPTLERIRVLLPEELLKRPMAENIQNEIREEFKVCPDAVDQITLNESADATFLTALSRDPGNASVIIIFESWQPCINSTLSYLRTLREVLGQNNQIIVCLIGRELQGQWATHNNEQDLKSWRSRLATLGDPYMHIHRWGEN